MLMYALLIAKFLLIVSFSSPILAEAAASVRIGFELPILFFVILLTLGPV